MYMHAGIRTQIFAAGGMTMIVYYARSRAFVCQCLCLSPAQSARMIVVREKGWRSSRTAGRTTMMTGTFTCVYVACAHVCVYACAHACVCVWDLVRWHLMIACCTQDFLGECDCCVVLRKGVASQCLTQSPARRGGNAFPFCDLRKSADRSLIIIIQYVWHNGDNELQTTLITNVRAY